MRRTMLVGLSLAIAAVVAVVVGAASGLDLESVALVGAASGAVVALVPDRTPLARVSGFFIGFAVAWAGYAVRATMLPDSTAGKAVAVAVVVLLCTILTAAARGRLPLWASLLGAGTLAGSYELTYAAAPPEMASTSLTTATTLLLTLALGFLAAVASAPLATRDETVTANALPTHDTDVDTDADTDADLDLDEAIHADVLVDEPILENAR